MNERIAKLKKQSKRDLYIALGSVISTGAVWYGLHLQSKYLVNQISETSGVPEGIANEAVGVIFSKFEPLFIVLFIFSVLYFVSEYRIYTKDQST